MAEETNQRNFFRLEYPPEDRPILEFDGVPHEVIDISEQGVSFYVHPDDDLFDDMIIRGTVDFRGRGNCKVQGRLIRVMGDKAVVRLTTNIPLAMMYAEQRYILQNYSQDAS